MSSTGNSLGDQIKSGVKGIHGIGEAIRGTALAETDKAFGTQSAETTKNETIAQKGVTDMKAADHTVGHNHGIKGTGAANTVPATSAGVHSTAPGNIGSTGATVGGGAAGVQEQPGVNQRF